MAEFQILTNMDSEIKEALNFLAVHAGQLSSGQLQLVKGLQRYYREHKELSERQAKTLFEIRKYLSNGRNS